MKRLVIMALLPEVLNAFGVHQHPISNRSDRAYSVACTKDEIAKPIVARRLFEKPSECYKILSNFYT